MKEKALLIGRRRAIVGVVTEPDPTSKNSTATAVLLLNAGMIHHAGPGRIYVKLARRLAQSGVSSVRFDLSGVGDSPVRSDHLPVVMAAIQEPREVMDDLQKMGFKRFILAGLCSGAYCAFRTALEDERVSGMALINTMSLKGELEMASRVWEQRYLKTSIYSRQAWKNLLTGKVQYTRLMKAIASKLNPFNRMGSSKKMDETLVEEIRLLTGRGQKIFFLCAEKDISVQYLQVVLAGELQGFIASGMVEQEILPGANHLFTKHDHQEQMINLASSWIVQEANSSGD